MTHTKKDVLTVIKTETSISQAVPGWREASEPLFEEKERRCKSEWDALPWLRWRRSRRKGQAWANRWNDSDLCTHSCPYRLAGSALPSAFGGSERLRKKEFLFYIYICFWRYPLPDSSLLITICFLYFISLCMLASAQEWRQKWIAFFQR